MPIYEAFYQKMNGNYETAVCEAEKESILAHGKL